ncbi:MAG: cytochrome b/b6 domain-containing protein [Woeseiaceae bacterium]|nr:cytochrome b/b6 domain-containing protein [Woeseiaceae bacterium]
MSATIGYTRTARILHWLVAGMIVLQYVLANLADSADSTIAELALYANHKSVGMTILALAVARLVWRYRNPPPPLPDGMAQWQVIASHVSHWGLYALLILMPVSGWLMSSASAYTVSWFNLFQFPDLVSPSDSLELRLKAVHETLAKLLFAFALVHILAALKHAVFDRDGVLARMSSLLTVGLFTGIIVLGVAGLGRIGGGNAATGAGSTNDAVPVGELQASVLPTWNIDYASSYILFRATQAGGEFEGRWPSWSAALQFDASALDESRFDVTVNTLEVDTADSDRDATLQQAEWFDTANHAEAMYRADAFRALDDGRYAADGQLIIKGKSAPVVLDFSVESTDTGVVLTGTASVDRLALDVGTGDWTDTTWIGQNVEVEVRVEATLSE